MPVLENHPSVGPEDALRRLEGGLGAGTKEYGAAPYVVMVQASFAEAFWPAVFYSWMSLKGHVQSYHNLDGVEMFVTRQGDSVLCLFMIIFAVSDALAEFAVSGYGADKMLLSLGVPAENINVQYLRSYS